MSEDERSGSDSEEEEVPQEEKDLALFTAAKSGDVKGVAAALETGADPKHTGGDGWTPLLWAACNGHEDVTRTLIGAPHNAAEPYIAKGHGSAAGFGTDSKSSGGKDDSEGKDDAVGAGANTPLQWASFKGHLRIVWMLLKAGLSPYDVDSCGNTSLHLAATGGSAPVLKCLMSEGFDLSQRNVYGNTALELADKAEVRQLLKKARAESACYSSGKKFSAAVWRYYCTHSEHFYCETETVRDQAVVEPGSSTTQPVRYYKGSLKIIKDLESRLQAQCKGTLTRENLEPLSKAVSDARANGCNVIWVHKGERTLSRLSAECVMRDEMAALEAQRPIGAKSTIKPLIKRIKAAREEGVRDEDGIEDAMALVRATEAEVTVCGVASLVEGIECASDANESEIKRLDAAIAEAVAAGSHAETVKDKQALQARLHAELDLNRSMADPEESAVVEAETGEPTEFCKYTMWDGTIFNTQTPGERLKFLQFRYDGLTKGIESGTASGAFAPLLARAVEFETTLALDVKEEEENEVARIEAEEKAAAKAAKKKKKGGKKKK